jgi:hypothetical protein
MQSVLNKIGLMCISILAFINCIAQNGQVTQQEMNMYRSTFVVNEIKKDKSLNRNTTVINGRIAGLNCRLFKGGPTAMEVLFVDSIGYKLSNEGSLIISIKPGWHLISAGNSPDKSVYPLSPVLVKFKKRRAYSIVFYLAQRLQ